MDRVLEGVKVIELGTHAAIPGAARVLADMGASVIKIESLEGDPWRQFGLSVDSPVDEFENPMFQVNNANKRGITLNLKSEEGKAIFYQLLQDTNIFLSNTRMASLEKLKISYEDLQPRFPHLIYGHISGYGLKGEDAGLPGYDITAFWARGGSLLDLGPEGTGPITTPYAFGDHTTSLAMVSGLLGALHRQTKTGKGEKVLISLLGTAIWVGATMITSTQYEDKFPKSRLHPLTPISTSYCCKDGEWITLTLLTYERDWSKFCFVIGREDLAKDERYCTAVAGNKNSEELVPLIAEVFKKQDRAYWIQMLADNDLPFAKTQHFKDIATDPMAWANGYLADFTFENGHKAAIPCTPIHFKEFAGKSCKAAPHLGGQTKEILFEMGFSEKKINELVAKKIVSTYKSGSQN